MFKITKAIAGKLQPIGWTDGHDKAEIKVPLKIFNPCGAATWYITEYDPKTGEAFGLCDLGMGFPELGYVSIPEMQAVKGPMGIGLEIDRYWNEDTTLAEVMEGGAQ
tara:strand:- start:1015 stop:1335 length:321 start_codon:yes stop_codon:yes gene_type:complete